MQIVGYNKEEEFIDNLKEATLTCTYEELKNISLFLNNIIQEYNADNPQCCLHFRDFCKKWEKSSTDLIVLIP